MDAHSAWSWLAAWGYLVVFFAPLLEILLPMVPGESVMVLTGYVASYRGLSLGWAVAVGMAGALAGITTSYGLGHLFGPALVRRYGRWVWVSETDLKRVKGWFNRFGKWSLPAGYYVPTARHLFAFVAGSAGVEWRVFALFAYPGALAWVLTFILLGYFFGQPFVEFLSRYYGWISLGVGLAILALLVWWYVEHRGQES